jgi:ABC-type multidrug transport system permease subunit
VPLGSLPPFIRGVAQFLPTTILITAFQGVLVHGHHLSAHWREIVIMILFIGASMTVATTLFRWDTEQKATSRDRLKVLIAIVPLAIAGVWFNLR